MNQAKAGGSLTRRRFLQAGMLAGAGTLVGGALGGCAPKAPETPDANAQVREARTYWLGEEPAVAEGDIAIEETTELLIIGAGNAGMVAAATACDLELDFIVADKGECVGDTREYLGAVNTKYSLEVAEPVDELQLMNELTRYASGRVDQRVIKTWLEEGKELVEWLTPLMEEAGKTLGVTPMEPDHPAGGTYYLAPTTEHFYLPTYEYPMRNDILEMRIQKAGREVSYLHDLVRLEHADGKVTGALFQTPAGLKRITATKGTLLATGGYAANSEMVQANLPLIERCCTAASYSPRCDGYGLRAGLWAGGAKDVNGAPVIFDRGAVKPGVDCGYKVDRDGNRHFPGTVYQLNVGSQPFLKVNRKGERFVNESLPYDTLCNAASYQPGGVWCQIFDANAPEDILRFGTTGCAAYTTAFIQMGMPLDDFLAMDGGTGLMCRADSLEELAAQLGFEGEGAQRLMDTIKRYNELAAAGEDADYGKEPHRLSSIAKPPFYGCWFGGALLTTLDGLRINADMQVLDANDRVIEGLYAAGDVSGCFFSDNYPEYIVACACGRTCTEGRHVARLLAGDLKKEASHA
ncbi:FAD-binding protein [Arabiibacter massiliensis]|uniref:FAD-binding protein n=1 Tax=Arabiibacter massiliensis TaxID=1870985 RepID=UPI0009BA83D8|nr:FAD-binding protein [Arabiibacter massiliensis]